MRYQELSDYKGYNKNEPQDNKLILEIERGKVSDEVESIQVGDVVIEDSHSTEVISNLIGT